MKLTESVFEGWNGLVIPKEVLRQILKNQEDAEIFNGLIKAGYNMQTIGRNEIIVERLKKFILSDTEGLLIAYLEQLVKLKTNARHPTYQIDQLIHFLNKCRELQKILEGKE